MICLQTRENSFSMPRSPISTKPLAKWLRETRKARGLTIRSLAAKAEVSHPRIAQIEGGDDASRDMIERLARAMAPEDADEYTSRNLLRAGLLAAGFLPIQENSLPQMSDYGIIYAPGWEYLSEEHRRLVGETARAAGQAAADSMIRIFSQPSDIEDNLKAEDSQEIAQDKNTR